MKQIFASIRLRDLMPRDDGWGREEGRDVFQQLLSAVDKRPEAAIIRISAEGIRQTDASFPRETVVELAYRYRGRKGICVVDLEDENLVENWSMAALKRGQPVFCWTNGEYKLLGEEPSSSVKELLDDLVTNGPSTTADVAKRLSLKTNNASTRLRQLVDQGYLVRLEQKAVSGGIEYIYVAPH